MDFKINCDVLLDALNVVQKGLPVKTPMPILTGIKLDVYENYLIMTSSNTDISIEVKIEGNDLTINEKGNCIIPGKYFLEIIRKINSRDVEISLMDQKIILIKAERSEFKLNTMDYNDYPEIEFINNKESFKIDANIIKTIIREVNFACATNEKRPILTGVNFKCEDGLLTCVATDSFRLSKKNIYLDNNINFNIVIPSKSLDELLKIIEDYNENLEISINNGKILINFKNISFQTRLLEGNYPDTSKIIPKEFPVIVKFNKDELIHVIERVSLLSPKEKDRNYNIIQLKITNNRTVQITSNNNEIGDALEEIIPIDNIIGPVFKIAFSSKYLSDSLKAFNSNNITINFTGELKPFIINDENNNNLLHLILPVKID